jgi:hypothetical protein
MRNCHFVREIPVALCCLAIIIAAPVSSQVLDGVPHLISYQGRLTDSLGNPVPDDEYLATFRIWSDSTSTSPSEREWISPDCPVQVTDGLFHWLLGSREGLPLWTMTNHSDLWLGIQVESDPEMEPRTRLASVPYSYKAWQADYAEYADSAGVIVSSIGESGTIDGLVNTDLVEDDFSGEWVFDFSSPFATTEKPHMYITVVLRASTNGLSEGDLIKGVVDVKGVPGNWTGFDITVSKLSDGSPISDTAPVYVTWMAIRP